MKTGSMFTPSRRRSCHRQWSEEWGHSTREQLQAFETVDCSRAKAAGLTYRPLEETLLATIEWARSLPAERPPMGVGKIAMPPALARKREAELLADWRARAAPAS
jgi:hypothetical protein